MRDKKPLSPVRHKPILYSGMPGSCFPLSLAGKSGRRERASSPLPEAQDRHSF
jgi:hypothetical protein